MVFFIVLTTYMNSMLAVMTFNVGYFLSVLGGIWLGTFALGGLSFDDNGSIHC
jgi:copper transporter 1